jgi:hypothetical protein
MPRRVHRAQPESAAVDRIALAQQPVGREVLVLPAVARDFPVSQHLGTRCRFQRARPRRMIEVSVRAEYPFQPLAHGLEHGREMGRALRPGIDQREVSRPDHVRVGPGPGHHAGIGRGYPTDERAHSNDFAWSYRFRHQTQNTP